jgi:glycosyltransferase involved in cell wall biosynthesis
VRDAAQVLAEELRLAGVDIQTIWCELADEPGLGRRRFAAWLAQLRAELDSGEVDGIILHYSSFAFGPRGLPVHAPAVARQLGAASVPVVGFLHELAYPFGRRGWRGAAQAASQRLALIPVLRACNAVVVTTEERANWLRSRRWLPNRRTRFVPVFSNLPPTLAGAPPESRAISIGVFGFSAPGIDVPTVVEALRLLAEAGHRVDLVLIGAPGSQSSAAAAWRLACSPHVGALRVTGVRAAQQIAEELAAVDIVLFPHGGGASARKGTLAAALAAAKPVVAVNGPEQWPRLVAEAAVAVTPPDPPALAAALGSFCANAAARVEQGARAERFYNTHMAPAVAAEAIVSALRELGVEAGIASLAGAA